MVLESRWQTLNQWLQSLLPGDGQLAACSSLSLMGRDGESAEEEVQGRRERGRKWEVESGGHQADQWCS